MSVHRTTDVGFIAAFARYADRLVVGYKNVGECGVLALGDVYGCELVIDDATARTIAVENGLRVTSTVPLRCDAIRAKMLKVAMVEHVADQLLEGDCYLPFGAGGFRKHVVENGLLDYDEI